METVLISKMLHELKQTSPEKNSTKKITAFAYLSELNHI